MKYNDANTRRSAAKWHSQRSDDYRPDSGYKNRLKKELREFSYIVEDKIWWKSLSSDDQIFAWTNYLDGIDSVSNESAYWYTYGSPYSRYFGMLSQLRLTKADHDRRMVYIMDKYKPQVIVKRELSINEILKGI